MASTSEGDMKVKGKYAGDKILDLDNMLLFYLLRSRDPFLVTAWRFRISGFVFLIRNLFVSNLHPHGRKAFSDLVCQLPVFLLPCLFTLKQQCFYLGILGLLFKVKDI